MPTIVVPNEARCMVELAKREGRTIIISDGETPVAIMAPPDYELESLEVFEAQVIRAH